MAPWTWAGQLIPAPHLARNRGCSACLVSTSGEHQRRILRLEPQSTTQSPTGNQSRPKALCLLRRCGRRAQQRLRHRHKWNRVTRTLAGDSRRCGLSVEPGLHVITEASPERVNPCSDDHQVALGGTAADQQKMCSAPASSPQQKADRSISSAIRTPSLPTQSVHPGPPAAGSSLPWRSHVMCSMVPRRSVHHAHGACGVRYQVIGRGSARASTIRAEVLTASHQAAVASFQTRVAWGPVFPSFTRRLPSPRGTPARVEPGGTHRGGLEEG